MKYTYEQLLAKIATASYLLKHPPRAEHNMTCPEEDPESCAPCTCGAGESRLRVAIAAAQTELKL